MTPADLKTWRAEMALSQRAAAAALGVSLPTYQRMERGANFDTGQPQAIDLRTALACAALAAGLSPWPSTRPASAIPAPSAHPAPARARDPTLDRV